jgi:hypothetical protein
MFRAIRKRLDEVTLIRSQHYERGSMILTSNRDLDE